MKFLFMSSLVLMMFSASASANYCATVYQGENFTGNQLDLYAQDQVANLNTIAMGYDRDWDNAISSAFVHPGCTLTVYQYQNFGIHYYTGKRIGVRMDLSQSQSHYTYSELGSFNNKASSLKCVCN